MPGVHDDRVDPALHPREAHQPHQPGHQAAAVPAAAAARHPGNHQQCLLAIWEGKSTEDWFTSMIL